MKTMGKRLAILSLVVATALGFSLSAFANSAGYNTTIPMSGLHTTLCMTTKGNSAKTYVRNACTSYTGQTDGWTWSFWVDSSSLGQVCPTTVVSDYTPQNIKYNMTVPTGSSVSGRGSTNGLLSSPVKVVGSVNFDY